MTQKEFFGNVINFIDHIEKIHGYNESETKVANDLKQYGADMIEKIETRNAKRSSTPSKTAIENEPIKENIVNYLTEQNGSRVASVIAEAIGISTQKASALCRQLVDSDRLTVEEVKVPKKGKQKAYSVK